MKLGFIGMGNMAQALAGGWIKSGAVKAEDMIAYAPHRDKLLRNAERLGFRPAASNTEVVSQADVVLMACKPYQIETVLAEVGGLLAGKPLLSVALGWDLEKYRSVLGEKQRVQFIMPNTPAEVLEGVFLFEEAHSLTEEEEECARELFSHLGKVIVLASHLMGVGGAVSGCGPAFVDMIIEAFADAAVKYGIQRQAAYEMVSQTLLGSAKLQLETGIHPAALKDAVCSPGGSTIRGVTALEKFGLRAACQAAVDAIAGE